MRVLFAILILLSFTCNAQKKKEMTISYGEKISLGKIESQTNFTISSEYGTRKITGEKINEYVFSKPGSYQITIEENASHKHADCDHSSLPNVIILQVSRVKMIFDGEHLTFSEPIAKNKETKGIIMNVPITLESYDGMPVPLNFTPVTSAGIGTNITANLESTYKELPVGKHVLKYVLNGVVTENSYLMFDFIDANSTVQTISLLSPINN